MKNFEVVERVSGSSTATYFLGIGGIESGWEFQQFVNIV